MRSLGIPRRLRRLQGSGGCIFLLAADHGLPAGPIRGLENPAELFRTLLRSPITGIVVNPGIAGLIPLESPVPMVVHLSAGTLLGRSPTSKVIVSSVERAVASGAEGVSVAIHFGDATEDRMLADAGAIVDRADVLGIPVLVMAYPPGATQGTAEHDSIRHAARAAAELGADLVQVPYPGTLEAVRSVVRGCPIPVLTTGGPRASSPEAFLEAVRAAMAGGAAGVSVGRNLFQHADPASFAEQIGGAVFRASRTIEVPGV